MRTLFLVLPVIGLFFLGTISTSNADDLIVLGKGHSKIYVSNGTDNGFDFDRDGLTDFYVRAHFTGNSNQMYKVDIKTTDECVDGSTHEDARMKIGFTNTGLPYTWYTDGFTAWTSWFKSGRSDDPNKQIDLATVNYPPYNVPAIFPTSGDDVIQKNPKDKQGSFSHNTSIKELDGQSGWEDSVFFNAPPGDYLIWSIVPSDGTGNRCNGVAGIGFPIFVK